MALRKSVLLVLARSEDASVREVIEGLHAFFPADEPAVDPVTRVLLTLSSLVRARFVAPVVAKGAADVVVADTKWRLTPSGRSVAR